MPRMRLVSECYQQILADDPDSSITMNSLRRLVKTEAVPSVKVGRKSLVDYDALLAYLSNPTKPKEEAPVQGIIRKVG